MSIETEHPVRVLVVEDDPSIITMLRRGLALEHYDVHVAETGPAALDKAELARPDLIILDLMLPGIDGIEVCRTLRQRGDDVPILMLTARDEIEDRVIGLDVGADDYLVKPFAFRELLARMRALLRRHERDEEPIGEEWRFADLKLDTATRFAHRGERRIELTTREFDLLRLFMRHPNQVLPREMIMDRVWGHDFYGESNVLEVYMSNLRRHLELDGEPRLLVTVRGAGYALRDPEA